MTLPSLVLNRSFIGDFTKAPAPCFALGFVEVEGRRTGFLAMRPDRVIPPAALADGIGFGHRLSEIQDHTLCQFVFNIYGFGQYSTLVNPANLMVRHVLEVMLERKDYFFLIVSSDNSVSVFRSNLGEIDLAGLRENLPVMKSATTSELAYERGVRAFLRSPEPPSVHLNWVCRDNPEYVNVNEDPLVLTSA
ncbi:hypothetical protein [Pseudovibrio sp. Tun.PSC04-5.I4]|uniref:hypothetical protein n=1 Tax=Pseudovibrio sp. Tun.PSC04-5.I4 TaxID=1798213 RepID=UPI00089101D6|nr:hypothetical protein [Pseudovibrio sp. Tun.PSC04-5.I4]SDQ37038.1 hypothetical protein SAMN04515695_1002 [Pseudovibrio sp. Tun.PSC04-5.I4]